MAAPIARIQPTKLPALPAATTPEQRYWKSFKSPLLIHEYGAVSSINFSPVSPYDFAITSSALVKVFSSKTRAVSKTISRFKDIAYSGHIRKDGKLLVAGDASGLIQVFNLASRAILKTWDEHKQPVHVAKFSPSNLTALVSASDDTTVRVWDLTEGSPIRSFLGHEDYVRAAAFLPESAASLVASGSYDGTVRLWDPRALQASAAIMKLSHPAPVDALLPMPGGTTILAASGPMVQVWDIVAAKPLAVLQNHQKTITTLATSSGPSGGGRRVLTGGLDGHVKIYDSATWNVVHGIKYPSPILSIGISPDEKHLAVGMVDGLLSVRTRLSGVEKVKIKEKEKVLDMIAAGKDPMGDGAKAKSNNYKRRTRGLDYKGEGANIIVEDATKKKKLSVWEHHLRKARYADALDAALLPKTPPVTTLTLFNELRYRAAIRAALSNRDEHTLQPLLKFLISYLNDPRYNAVIVEVSLLMLDMYSHVLGQSPQFDKSVQRLHERVKQEVENSKEASRTKGMLEMFMAGNAGAPAWVA